MGHDAITRRFATAGFCAAMAAARAPAASELRLSTSASRVGPPGIPAYAPPASIAGVSDLYRRMTAPVRVNGEGPFPFVVDTGSNQTVISTELAAQLGLALGPLAPLNGVAGVQMAPTSKARLDVGTRRYRDAALSVLPTAAIGGSGLLGLDDLGDQALTLDFRRVLLRVEPGRKLRDDPDAVVLQAHRRSGQLTLVDADLAGVRVTAFLDSGAQNTIGNLALLAVAMQRNPTLTWIETPILSATGQTIDARIASLPRLRVGGLKMPRWPVAFADLHTFRMWNLIDRPAILLGVDVLSRFEYVCLDFTRNEVRFRLPSSVT